jgi:hypothetical protein
MRAHRDARWRVALVAIAVALVLPAAAAAARHAPVRVTAARFSGSCHFSGPISPSPPITLVPVAGPHFSDTGTGACTGSLDGGRRRTSALSVSFRHVATLFDTCELGPDVDLPGTMTLRLGRTRASFAITVDLVRLALAGPFLLTTPGGGRGAGVAQFIPANAATAVQLCATTGIKTATLSASFSTLSPLVGTARRTR